MGQTPMSSFNFTVIRTHICGQDGGFPQGGGFLEDEDEVRKGLLCSASPKIISYLQYQLHNLQGPEQN